MISILPHNDIFLVSTSDFLSLKVEAIFNSDCNSYLNVPFDVSKVVFVATANRVQTMPAPLLDRMEVIELPGYTPEEKLHIAMRHLIPRVLEQHGITNKHIKIPEVS
jgi:ATP-dependent Lon protease